MVCERSPLTPLTLRLTLTLTTGLPLQVAGTLITPEVAVGPVTLCGDSHWDAPWPPCEPVKASADNSICRTA